MKIYAFQGLRYAAPSERAGALAAPPFDQIDDTLRDRLQSSSPHHFTHLTRPVARGEVDAYNHARDLHASWLAAGELMQDPEPRLYPYAIERGEGWRRLGLACLVDASPDGEGDLRPHEQTVSKPLEDRLKLLRTLAIDLEPVLLIAEDDDASLDRMLADDVEHAKELVRHRDEARSEVHVLYAIEDPERIAEYQRVFSDRQAVIADGHHRTKVAQLLARESGAQPGTAPASKLAVLTSLSAQELQIDPVHRGLEVALHRSAMLGSIASHQGWGGSTGGAFAAAVAEAAQPSIGVRFAGSEPEIWTLRSERQHPSSPTLSVVLLHDELLAAAGVEGTAATDGTIRYKSDPDDLWASISGGELQVGFWLPPMAPALFAAATAEGQLLPPKSTRFLPKLISGLVWSSHDARLL